MNNKKTLSEIEQLISLRRNKEMSQEALYSAMGISVRTGQGWEQGRRRPSGPALVLVRLILKRPDLVTVLLEKDMSEVHG